MSKDEGVICWGSYLFGSACGHYEKCKDEMESLRQSCKLPEIKPQNLAKPDAYSLLGDLTPIKDFLMACRFAENKKIREESESLLRRYFA